MFYKPIYKIVYYIISKIKQISIARFITLLYTVPAYKNIG